MILVQAWVSKLAVHILFSRKINNYQACYVDSSMDEAQPHLKFSFQKENWVQACYYFVSCLSGSISSAHDIDQCILISGDNQVELTGVVFNT